MSRFYRLFFIGLWLCSASSAYAIAPEVIHAVADKPLTLSLESGETLRVDVVAVMESSFIAVSPDGEVMSLDYENIASVKIATTAEPKTEVAPALAPSQARTAPTPLPPRVPALL